MTVGENSNLEILREVFVDGFSEVNEYLREELGNLKAEFQLKIATIEEQKNTIQQQAEKIRELERSNTDLTEKTEDLTERTETVENSKPTVTLEQFQELQARLSELSFNFIRYVDQKTTWMFDLKKIEYFRKINWTVSNFKLDNESRQVTGEELNVVLYEFFPVIAAQKRNKKTPLKEIENNPIKSNSKFVNDYKHSPRVFTRETNAEYANYNAKDWIKGDLKVKGSAANKLDPANMKDSKVTLGTGTGKSTTLLRCIAHHTGGTSLVVPNQSLKGPVLTAHNNWLSKGLDTKRDEEGNLVTDQEKRVTICLLCGGKHTAHFDENGKEVYDNNGKHVGKYETTDNRESNMINLFTWWEFLDAFINNPTIIKPWVVFDEAHDDTPCYQTLMNSLLNLSREKGERSFGITRMSATFDDMPTSGILYGQMTDKVVDDFGLVDKKLKDDNLFAKKVIIFCEDMSKLNLEPLSKEIDGKKVEYIILDEALKGCATDIVRSKKAPLLIFASNEYSAGYSFGDVNVISTGIVSRTIMTESKGSLVPTKINVKMQFADGLQQRGRGAREKEHKSFWMSMTPPFDQTKDKLMKKDYGDKDIASVWIERYFKIAYSRSEEKDKREARENIRKVINKFSEEPKVEKFEKSIGYKYFKTILLNELITAFNTDLFKSERNKGKGGRFTFDNKIIEYCDKDLFEQDLVEMIIYTSREAIKTQFSYNNKWVNNLDEDDDYVFRTAGDANLCASYLQARDLKKTSYEFKIIEKENKKKEILIIKFEMFNKTTAELKELCKISEQEVEEQIDKVSAKNG